MDIALDMDIALENTLYFIFYSTFSIKLKASYVNFSRNHSINCFLIIGNYKACDITFCVDAQFVFSN